MEESLFRDNNRLLEFTLITLLIFTTVAMGENSDDNGTDLCQNTYTTVVKSDVRQELAIQVFLTSTDHSNVITLPGYYLPEECGPENQRCNVQFLTGHPSSDRELSFVPVTNGTNGGIAITEFRSNNLTNVSTFVATAGIPANCTPTGTFFDHPWLFTACLNVSLDHSYVEFLRLNFDDSEDITTASFEFISDTIVIYNPETLTKILYVQGGTCFFPDHLYFIEDSYLLEIEADFSTRRPDWIYGENRLDNCPPPFTRFEYIQTDEKLLIQCGNERVLFYDPCDGEVVEHYEIEDGGSPYPCSGLVTIAFLKDSTVTVELPSGEHSTVNLPSGSIEYGKCIGAESPVFVFQLSNGSSYAVNLTDEKLVELANSGNISNSSFKFPLLDSDYGYIVGLLNKTNFDQHNLVLANLSCAYSPAVSEIPLSFQPGLVSLFPGRGSHPCQCVVEPPTKPVSTPLIVPTPQTTQTIPSTTPLIEPTLQTARTIPSSTLVVKPTLQTARTIPSSTLVVKPTLQTARTIPSSTFVVKPTLQTARTIPSTTPLIVPTLQNGEPVTSASAFESPKLLMPTRSPQSTSAPPDIQVVPPAGASESNNSDDLDYLVVSLVTVVFLIGTVIAVVLVKWWPFKRCGVGRPGKTESTRELYPKRTRPSRSSSIEREPEHVNEDTQLHGGMESDHHKQPPEFSTVGDQPHDNSNVNIGQTFDPQKINGAVQDQNDPSYGAAPFLVIPTLEPAEGTHNFELVPDLYNTSDGVCMIPMQASAGGYGECDLASGHQSVVPPTNIHRNSVATQLQRRTDTEEKDNDFRAKTNVLRTSGGN